MYREVPHTFPRVSPGLTSCVTVMQQQTQGADVDTMHSVFTVQPFCTHSSVCARRSAWPCQRVDSHNGPAVVMQAAPSLPGVRWCLHPVIHTHHPHPNPWPPLTCSPPLQFPYTTLICGHDWQLGKLWSHLFLIQIGRDSEMQVSEPVKPLDLR